ncbi:MAG: hypothetical protein ACRDPR_23595, partial [Nocardioidaceae bacterium]
MLKSKSKSKPQKLLEHAEEMMDRLAPHLEHAKEKAAPVIADAKVKAAPVIAEARDKATPAIDSARSKFNDEVLPVIAAAVAAATEATEEARGEARKRGAATAAALRGEVAAPKKKSHKFRSFLLLVGLGGVAAVVAKKMSEREASTAWQSSYTPTPTAPGQATASGPDGTPTTGAAAGAATRADDEGAAADPRRKHRVRLCEGVD